jgi:hypothetical protein
VQAWQRQQEQRQEQGQLQQLGAWQQPWASPSSHVWRLSGLQDLEAAPAQGLVEVGVQQQPLALLQQQLAVPLLVPVAWVAQVPVLPVLHGAVQRLAAHLLAHHLFQLWGHLQGLRPWLALVLVLLLSAWQPGRWQQVQVQVQAL